MFFNILNSMAVGKRRDVNDGAVLLRQKLNHPSTPPGVKESLEKAIAKIEYRARRKNPLIKRITSDRCAAWFLTLAATYLAYQIVPTLWQEVWR